VVELKNIWIANAAVNAWMIEEILQNPQPVCASPRLKALFISHPVSSVLSTVIADVI
jgi:hypothetical protein